LEQSLIPRKNHKSKPFIIISEIIVNLLQDGVVAIGKTKLGIIQSETGNVDPITHHHDKLIGQCLSIASLKSIHKNTDTSKRTLAWHFIKNDGYSIFQANSKNQQQQT
jgi:hypothetical protein